MAFFNEKYRCVGSRLRQSAFGVAFNFHQLERKNMMVMKWTAMIFFALTILTPLSSFAQSQPADNMAILREKIRADKKLVVAVNMQLTKSEAKAFWPIYKRYQKDLTKHFTRLKSLIEKYAQNHKTMTDKVAKELVPNYVNLLFH